MFYDNISFVLQKHISFVNQANKEETEKFNQFIQVRKL